MGRFALWNQGWGNITREIKRTFWQHVHIHTPIFWPSKVKTRVLSKVWAKTIVTNKQPIEYLDFINGWALEWVPPKLCSVIEDLDGNFASYFSCWPTIDLIQPDWSRLPITRRAFNDGNFSALVSGSPHVHLPPHPILKHRSECSILCADEHASQRAAFEINIKDDQSMDGCPLDHVNRSLLLSRNGPTQRQWIPGICRCEITHEMVKCPRASPFHFRAMP